MRRARAAVAAVVATALLASCSKVGLGTGGRTNAFTIPHVLRFAMDTDVPGLNPHLVTAASTIYLSQLTMAYLVRYGRDARPVPELATVVPTQANGGVSRDGETITWHLRRGVRWSDGAPFSADDVVWTVRAIRNRANNEVSLNEWDRIDRVEAPDAATVRLHLKEPLAVFLPTFFGTAGANPCILPKHLLARLPNINQAAYNALPVGIGPFRYVKWIRGDRVELEANPLYWRGRPKLDRIEFRIIPDRNTLLNELHTGSIDLWPEIPPAYSDRLGDVPGFTTYRRPGFWYDHFDFNTDRPIVNDKIVRRALRFATDRPTLASKVGHGAVIVQESMIPKANVFYEHLPLVPYDPAKARALLDADGWKPGRDGIREKGGRRLTLVAAYSAGAPDIDTRVELIRGWWKDVGVELEGKRYANVQLFAPYAEGGILYGGNFDLIFFAWGGNVSGDASSQYASTLIPPHGQNDSHYRSAVADDALEGFKTSFDPARRRRYARVVQETIAADVPLVVYDSRIDVFAANVDLKGYDPSSAAPFDDMMKVDL